MLDDIAVGNFVRFRLSDTGIGITREAMQKIFDPFFSTKEIGKGSGLGLSMVLGFAKQSKGTVFVESEVNKGTTFILLVPAIDSDVTVDGGPAEAETLTKKFCDILLVEDEISVLQVIENQLTAHGHRVHTATNGEEAAAMLRGGLKPDVLITDNIMPGTIQGVALIQIAFEHVRGVSTIMISGYPADARDQLEVNMSDTLVLTKPVKKADILQAIDDCHVSL